MSNGRKTILTQIYISFCILEYKKPKYFFPVCGFRYPAHGVGLPASGVRRPACGYRVPVAGGRFLT